MQPQIVHDAEIHRQHVRLRIPIGVEIDGTRYEADDWSMGGFGVVAPISTRQPGERFPARLLFPFEDFELTLRLDCQMIYVLPEGPRFGCKFLALSQGQLGLFRYLMDAYLAGEIVSGGDILVVASRDEAAQTRTQRLIDAMSQEERLGRRLRRYFGYALFLLAGLGLALAVAAGLRERYFVVATDRAVIEAPLFRLRATAAGTVEPAGEGLLAPGAPAAGLRLPDGQLVTLPSPCDCVLDEWVVPPGQPAQPGQLIATLVAADQPLLVRAQLPVDQAMRLSLGQSAVITVPNQPEPYQGTIERIDFKLPTGEAGERFETGGDRRISVILRPDRPFDFENLGFPVNVRFH